MSAESGIDPEEPMDEGEEGADEPRIGCLASLIPVTTPGCASLLTAVFLLTTALTVWGIFWLDPNNVPWRHSFNVWRILGILALGALLPFVVYKTIGIWLEGTPQEHPELESAWRAGLNALAANELSIDSVPIFLITGSNGESQERAIMNASGMRFSVEGVPQGPAPIHWYANSEAIYLFCSDASWSSALASLREEISSDAESPILDSEGVWDASRIDYAPQASASPDPVLVQQHSPERGIRGTLELNQFVPPSPSAPSPTSKSLPSAPPPSSSGGSFRGTLMLGDGHEMNPVSNPAPAPTVASTPSTSLIGAPLARQSRNMPTLGGNESDQKRKQVLVSHQYSTSCLQELMHLGHLVRKARQPVCPINGILSLVQIESIHSTPAELEELQKALKADMETIRHGFRIRVPVTALVVGLEKERGFRELVLRVGRDRALSQRFGKRFDVQAIPTKEELAALAIHICGVFEDWAYALFREEQSLMRPGNTRLYELLSKVRCSWKSRLSEILAGGFGCEPGKSAEQNSLLVSGCYLAATGDTEDRQAFVKGVIEKLNDEQELIEWTSEALQSNYRQNIAANLGMIVTVGLLISLLLMYLLL